jgi:hypothetical protein
MATLAGSYVEEQWTHDWQYGVESFWGDADYDDEHGAVVTIVADSPEQAEQRALTYAIANFDGPRPIRAEAEPERVDLVSYRVRLVWPRER